VSQPSEIDVTVVVPVFNTGKFIEPCIESLVNQSLPADRFEVIFVDDGSTDATPQRLDELASYTPNVQVFHEPNSGWPGRPRNIGIDNARGRYVFFCDHDDWLSLSALERMVDYADKTEADVLIPKMVGHGRSVPRELFRETRPDATVLTAPLMSSLTPHKLFRRAFLDDRGLRFPEGKRRLEDHVFVIAAYFQASRIVVLSDQPYYHHIRRDDDANAAYDQMEAASYYTYVREVLDTIEAYTEPGPERQTALDRPFVGSILDRLRRSRQRLDNSGPDQHQVFDAARSVLLERYPPDYAQHLSVAARLRAGVVRDGDFELLCDLNDRLAALTTTAAVGPIRRVADSWQLDVQAHATFADGSPLRMVPRDDGDWSLDPRLLPAALHGGPSLPADEMLRVASSASVVERSSDEEWLLPVSLSAASDDLGDGGDRGLAVTCDIGLNPNTAAGGSPLPDGIWDVRLRVNVLGIDLRTRVKGDASLLPEDARIDRSSLFFTPNGLLSVDVGRQRHKRKVARETAAAGTQAATAET
jgi:glycosyltransferase involved in cell wall biosynthesis